MFPSIYLKFHKTLNMCNDFSKVFLLLQKYGDLFSVRFKLSFTIAIDGEVKNIDIAWVIIILSKQKCINQKKRFFHTEKSIK